MISSTSGFGHVQPMLPLALALRDAGHEVQWATGADSCIRIEAAGIPATAVGLTNPDRIARFRQRYPEAADSQGEAPAPLEFARIFGEVAAPAAIDGLLAMAEAWAPDLMIHEAAEFAAPAVAARVGIPNALHAYGYAVPVERMVEAAERADAMGHVGLPQRPVGGCYDHLYIDIYPPSLQPGDLSHLGRRVFRRPASGDALPDDRLPDEVAAMIGADRPLVYLTFGTVFNVHETFGRAVAALAGLPVNAVVTVGPNGDPASLDLRAPNVHVARYVPQSLLLDHTAAVISHAGSGTLLATMAAGIPQLCLPQGADQFRNAAACAGAGAGLALLGAEATQSAIASSVERLLAEDSFRAAAASLADEIGAMPDAAALVPVLEDLAQAAT